MSDFVTLTCPSCGGKLQITQDIDRFACGYCGQEHVVKRGGGIVMIAPVVEGLRRVQIGTDKTAAELAIVRLEKEIAGLEAKLSVFQTTPFEKLYPPSRAERLLPWGSIFFVFATCVGANGTNPGIAFLWGLIALCCFLGWIYLGQKRVAAGKVELARQISMFEKPIRERKAELEKNRQLVRRA